MEKLYMLVKLFGPFSNQIFNCLVLNQGRQGRGGGRLSGLLLFGRGSRGVCLFFTRRVRGPTTDLCSKIGVHIGSPCTEARIYIHVRMYLLYFEKENDPRGVSAAGLEAEGV